MLDLQALCKEVGLIFYDAEALSENGKKIYRISVCKSIDIEPKNRSVSLDECQKLSEILSPIFDVNPPLSGEYFLEISSPGLERKLTKLEHFKLSLGELVKITTENKDKIEAKIISVNDDNITLEALDSKELLKLKFIEIKKAKTFILW